MKLLVVEDERMLCDTIAKSLHHAGYEVDCCYDGAEALERLLIEQYDLIVLDLHLPGMDGMEVLERLRQTPAGDGGEKCADFSGGGGGNPSDGGGGDFIRRSPERKASQCCWSGGLYGGRLCGRMGENGQLL